MPKRRYHKFQSVTTLVQAECQDALNSKVGFSTLHIQLVSTSIMC